MSAQQPCGRPGCDGVLDGGYCDTCGMAPAASGPAVSGPAASGPAASGADETGGRGSQRCPRPGCDGALDGGYCDVCGMAAAPARATATATGPATARSTGPATAPSTGPATAPSADPSTGPGSGPSTGPGSGSTGSRPSRRGSGRTTTATGRSRLGAGLVDVPPVPRVDPASALLADPQVAEEKRFCSTLRQAGRRGRGTAGPAAPRASARSDGTPVLVHPEADAPARSSPASTRCRAAWPTAGSAGSTWRWTATSTTAGWCSRACSTPATRTRWPRPWRSAGSSPRSATRTSSRSTTSCSTPTRTARPVGYIVMEYVGGSSLKQLLESAPPPGRHDRADAGAAGHRLRAGDAARARLPARASGWRTATSSRTT